MWEQGILGEETLTNLWYFAKSSNISLYICNTERYIIVYMSKTNWVICQPKISVHQRQLLQGNKLGGLNHSNGGGTTIVVDENNRQYYNTARLLCLQSRQQ